MEERRNQDRERRVERRCPFLVRVFYTIRDQPNQNKKQESIEILESKKTAQRELLLHLWFDSKLSDVCKLIKMLVPAARGKQQFQISKLSCNPEGKWSKQFMKTVILNNMDHRNDKETLEERYFRVGDHLDVVIQWKHRN